MTGSILLVLCIAAGAVALLLSERLPPALVALGVVFVLVASGTLSTSEALAGFASPAVVSVGAMLVLSAGLLRTGAVQGLAAALGRVARYGERPLVLLLMVGVGTISAFLNNTAAVAILLPVVMGIARDHQLSPSRLLLPLSFASMFGGVCTLIGTSTNLLVSSLAEASGLAPLGMFELTPVGLVLFAVGILYMVGPGLALLPARRPASEAAAGYALDRYLADVRLLPSSSAVGRPLAGSPLVEPLGLDVLRVRRAGVVVEPTPELVLEAGDELQVRCGVEEVRRLAGEIGVELVARASEAPGEREELRLVEAVLGAGSPLSGSTLKRAGLRSATGATVIGLRHRGGLLERRLKDAVLRPGDTLLLEASPASLKKLRGLGGVHIVGETELVEFRRSLALVAVAILVGVVVASTLGLLPIAVAALGGALLLVLTRCLVLEEALAALDLPVLFLLAGMLSLGTALERTGAAALLGQALVDQLGGFGPIVLLAACYLVTTLLTEVMSNNATAVLLVPVAIEAANRMGVDPRPYLIAVALAASASFLSPIGYQTNLLVYGPGRYRFGDFARVGGLLSLLFGLVAVLLIPLLWPF